MWGKTWKLRSGRKSEKSWWLRQFEWFSFEPKAFPWEKLVVRTIFLWKLRLVGLPPKRCSWVVCLGSLPRWFATLADSVESFASVVCLVGLPPWLTQLGLLQWFSFEPIAFPKVKSMVGMTFLGVQGSVVCHRDGAVDSLWRVSFEGRKSCWGCWLWQL